MVWGRDLTKVIHTIGIILGFIGILFLDLGFNGSGASDLFFPPQLRNSLPAPIANPSPPPGLGGYLPAGQNVYFYVIGGTLLGIGMLLLVLSNRRSLRKSFLGHEIPSRSKR